MKRLMLAVAILVAGVSTASAQSWRGGENCESLGERARAHYRRAVRNDGIFDEGEQRVQQQLQAAYDACRARRATRYAESPGYGGGYGGGYGRRDCSELRERARAHYRRSLRNDGIYDEGEQRVQQQMQAAYDACRAGRY